MVRHAAEVGWTPLSPSDALAMRAGYAGLTFRGVLEEALHRFTPWMTYDAIRSVVENIQALPPTIVFDRVTGEPVWPIEECAVDTVTDVPGEEVYPTQSFPTKPPPFARRGVSLEDANDLNPEIHALAVAEMRRFRLGPLFTPPSLQGTFQRPGASGGTNRGGAAFDPETGLLYVRTTEDA